MAQIVVKNIYTGSEEVEVFQLEAHVCGLCKGDIFALKVDGAYIAQAEAGEDGCASLPLPDFDYRAYYATPAAWLYAHGHITDEDIEKCGPYAWGAGFTTRAMGMLYRGACAVRHMGTACAPGICEHVRYACPGWTFLPTENAVSALGTVYYYKWTGYGCDTKEMTVSGVYDHMFHRDSSGRIYLALLLDFKPGYLCVVREGREYCGPTPVWSGTVVYYVL